MSASTTSISDLPLPLRTRIITAVQDLPRPPPLQPSLCHLLRLPHDPLPDALLSIAQSSPTLSSAVADALGVRALILGSTTAKSDLSKWITALAPFVKAVSFWDPVVWTCSEFSINRRYPELKPANLLANAIAALNAIAATNVALRTLDITDIPFKHAHEEREALQEVLGIALANNRSSFHELAVPLHEISTSALLQESLPNLQVVEFEYSTDNTLDMATVEVIRALKGHADDDRGESRLTELRFLYVDDPPCTSVEESGCGVRFFQRIRTLDIQNSLSVREDQNDNLASFVSLFPRLNCLRWNGEVTLKNMQRIVTACPHLTELHLSPQKRYRDSDMVDLLGALSVAQGRVRTLRIKATMSDELVRLLGKTNPDLETFSAEIGPGNIAALTSLLATHCRKLRTLDLSYLIPDDSEQQSLGPEGWRGFCEALQSASSELRDIVLQSGDEINPCEPDFTTIVDAIASVLESLSSRARIVRFQVPGGVCRYSVIIDGLCRLLNVATKNGCNLEELELLIYMGDVDLMWDDDEQPEVKFRELMEARRRFTDAARHLYYLNLFDLDGEAEEALQDMGVT